MYYIYLSIAIAIIIIGRFLNASQPKSIFDIYRKPNKWYPVKFLLFYLLLWVRKFKSGIKGKGKASGYGVKSYANVESMERSQPLSDHPKAIDAVYFNAASPDGYYFVGATARRPQGVVNGFVYLKIPAVGLLLAPKLPDTTLVQTAQEMKDGVFGAEGLLLEPIEAMKRWRITYRGKMKDFTDPEKIYDVILEAEWTSELPYFDYDTDMNPLPVARSFARELWSREYFDTLQKTHQTHYEQHGDIRGVATINGQIYPIHMNSMRDHTYGYKREWKNLHRYAIQMATLEDGTRFCVGVVCSPISFSSLEIGYVYTPEGSLHAIRSCDFKLYEHGENGKPPLDYGFNFYAGGIEYRVQVEVEDSPELYMNQPWDTRIVERLARFTVNGMKGWGIAEWQYRYNELEPICTWLNTDDGNRASAVYSTQA